MATHNPNTFDILLLIARPAAGKSEIIDHLKKIPLEQRLEKYHIGDFQELDDFPMLWTWFEEDAILTELGFPRIHTDAEGYFLHPYQWDLLIRRINLEYDKILRDNPDFHQHQTLIIEFSRGTSHGGYKRAFEHLSKEIAQRMAILYIDVSWEESRRKNQARFNPEKPDSILEHGLPEDKMEKLNRYSDWDEIRSNHPERIQIQGCAVPYSVFENEDDVTSQGGEALSQRLQKTLTSLYELYREEK